MDARELVKFLKLLRDSACLNNYWRNRINEVLQKLGVPENE